MHVPTCTYIYLPCVCVWTCIQTIDYTCFCIHPSALKRAICVYTRAYICMSLPVLIYLICACVWMHVQPVDYIFMCKHSNPPSNNILYVCYLIFFFVGRVTARPAATPHANRITPSSDTRTFFRCSVVYLYVGQGRTPVMYTAVSLFHCTLSIIITSVTCPYYAHTW